MASAMHSAAARIFAWLIAAFLGFAALFFAFGAIGRLVLVVRGGSEITGLFGAVLWALIAWGAYALMLRVGTLAISPKPADEPAAEAPAAGLGHVPWGAVVFSAAIWTVSCFSFGIMLLLPLVVFVVSLFMIGRFYSEAVRCYSNPSLGRLAARRRVFIGTLAVLIGAAGIFHGQSYMRSNIRKAMQPLIAAIDAFHDKTGRYPGYDELVPGYIPAIPKCPGDGLLSSPIFYEKRPSNTPFPGPGVGEKGYLITCNTVIFMKYTYDSEKKRWSEWD